MQTHLLNLPTLAARQSVGAAVTTVQNETLALRRINAAEEPQFGPLSFGPGVWEFDRFFTIQIHGDGDLYACVDLYSQAFYRLPPDGCGDFDHDLWDAQKVHLIAPASREHFYAMHRLCRALLAAQTRLVELSSPEPGRRRDFALRRMVSHQCDACEYHLTHAGWIQASHTTAAQKGD